MNRLLLMLGFALLSRVVAAQVYVDGVDINQERVQYITLILADKGLVKTSLVAMVEYGQHMKGQQQGLVVDELGHQILFNSHIAALNFLYFRGWDYVDSYDLDRGGKVYRHYLLQRAPG